MSSKHVTKALRTPQTLTLSHPQKKKYICVRINDMYTHSRQIPMPMFAQMGGS